MTTTHKFPLQLPTTASLKIIDFMQIKWIFVATLTTLLQTLITIWHPVIGPLPASPNKMSPSEVGLQRHGTKSKMAAWLLAGFGLLTDLIYILLGLLYEWDVIQVSHIASS